MKPVRIENAFGQKKTYISAEREWLSLLKLSHNSTIETSGNESYLERQNTFGVYSALLIQVDDTSVFSKKPGDILNGCTHSSGQNKVHSTKVIPCWPDSSCGHGGARNARHYKRLQIASREKPTYFWKDSIPRVIFVTSITCYINIWLKPASEDYVFTDICLFNFGGWHQMHHGIGHHHPPVRHSHPTPVSDLVTTLPPDQTWSPPPGKERSLTPHTGTTSGRYTSYWIAFLLERMFFFI